MTTKDAVTQVMADPPYKKPKDKIVQIVSHKFGAQSLPVLLALTERGRIFWTNGVQEYDRGRLIDPEWIEIPGPKLD